LELLHIQKKIRNLLAERDGILLAHNYQRGEIQDIADIIGDSLELSLQAAKVVARVIVFCGVHFMAESASILSPEKTVILPRLDAGCPMADMITVEQLREKKLDLEDPYVITYVNSSAAVKAESNICCTSANVISVIKVINGKRPILFTPDRNLGQWAQEKTGRKMTLWKGFCPTHHRLTLEEVHTIRQAHPDALFVAHPECRSEVLAVADHVCSTSGMFHFIESSDAREFIIGTEEGMLHPLRKRFPDRRFFLASPTMVCPNMKKTRLEDVYNALLRMQPEVKVPEEIRIPAHEALKRMLAIPRDK